MKKISIFCALTIVALILSSCPNPSQPITPEEEKEIGENAYTVTLHGLEGVAIDRSITLTAEFTPLSADAVEPDYKWESLNPMIATVDQTGRVTGVSEGLAIIRLTTKDNKALLVTKGVRVTTKKFITAWWASKSISLPLNFDLRYNFFVDWGDGTPEELITSRDDAFHTYAKEGIYYVSITAPNNQHVMFDKNSPWGGFSFHSRDLIDIIQWGGAEFSNCSFVFREAQLTTLSAIDSPALSGSIFAMFWEAESFNHDIGNWDVSNVTSMNNVFRGASSFNQDLSSWDVSNVTDMSQIFWEAESFNQDLSGWDLSSFRIRLDAIDDVLTNMFYGSPLQHLKEKQPIFNNVTSH